MIQVEDIRRKCFASTYKKGRTYFLNEMVKSLDTEEDKEYGKTYVQGEVRGSGRQNYEVKLELSPEDEILDYSCTCLASQEYWGICKHGVALALAYQLEQKKRRQKASYQQLDIKRNTSEALRQIMYQYTVKNRMNRMGGLDGEVYLECSFQMDRYGLLLECRIGCQRMYVVKNLVKLICDVEKMKSVRYGAKLEFVHDLTAFTQDSREILRLLGQAIRSRYPDYQEDYYSGSGNFRSILLKNENLEGFLDHFLGKEIRVDEQMCPVVDKNPPVTLFMKETLGGAELETEPMIFYSGSHSDYVYKDGSFWHCSPEFSEAVLPLWKAMREPFGGKRGRTKTLFLSKGDYGNFCGNLVPMLRSFVDIQSGSLNLEDYAPAEPEFLLYLEMPEDLLVRVTAEVRYAEEHFDLMAPVSGGGSYRNIEREQEVRSVIGAYFGTMGQALSGTEGKRKRQELEDGLPVRDLDEDMKENSLSFNDKLPMYAEGEEALYRLVSKGLKELGQYTELYVDDSIRRLQLQASPRITMGVSLKGDLLDLEFQVQGVDPGEISGILENYRRRKKYYRLKNGDFLRLEEGGMGSLAELTEGLSLSEQELKQGSATLPRYRALYLEKVLGDSGEVPVKKESDYRRLVSQMKTYCDGDYEIPENIHAKLRRYQEEGFRWLKTLDSCGFGGILADDMGLGKTLQVITYFQSMVNQEEGFTALVVSPASLVYNWESELRRFAPDLRIQIIAGTAEERREQLEHAGEYHVNVTSYDLIKRDVDKYEGVSFGCCVLDEAQYIKNAGTQAAKAVKQIQARGRLAMTGTPIENRLSDLWSIFDFLMPGYLYSYQKFRNDLELPIIKQEDEVAAKRLQRMVSPFLLRRKKEDVLKDLPEKLEESVYIRMTKEQEKIYQASVWQLQQELNGKDEKEFQRERLQILAQLTRLRQICCSPELCYENYTGGSGKVEACLDLLRTACEGGHKVLVFSQFTSMLELLRREWKKEGGESLYLSGKDSKKRRREMVDEFQEGSVPVFFISLKAGGTGLNLTAADMVIHCDPWWNLAAQNQATDRAHRIGQDRVVTVMKLVAKNSIEEKIAALQARKAELADQIMEGEEVQDFTLDRDKLMEIFSL
ncbi:MAG: SNF2 helicase associated domain-containing protein [Clostridiales bacterium]|nr:SNF2 helicase associated domain-containing protein [Clostridiales bacterium]